MLEWNDRHAWPGAINISMRTAVRRGGGAAAGMAAALCTATLAWLHGIPSCQIISRTVLGRTYSSHTECAADNNAEISLLERV